MKLWQFQSKVQKVYIDYGKQANERPAGLFLPLLIPLVSYFTRK